MMAFFRWVGYLLASFVVLAILGVLGLYGASAYRLNQTYDVDVQNVAIPSDSAAIERGRHESPVGGTHVAEKDEDGQYPATRISDGEVASKEKREL